MRYPLKLEGFEGQNLELEPAGMLAGPPRRSRTSTNKNYDSPVRRLVRERQAIKVVNAHEAIDDYDKWHGLYKKLIVDRSQH